MQRLRFRNRHLAITYIVNLFTIYIYFISICTLYELEYILMHLYSTLIKFNFHKVLNPLLHDIGHYSVYMEKFRF